MRPYLQVAKITIQELAAYPNKFFTLTVINAASVLVFFILWQAIFAQKSAILGYTLPSMLTYYTLTYFARDLTASGQVARLISQGIHEGKLSFFLIKPIEFSVFNFSRAGTEKVVKSLVPAILVFMITQLFPTLFLPPSTLNLALFFISLTLAAIISFLIYSLVGTLAFWTIKSGGLRSIIGRLIDVLNGSLFPLDFLPPIMISFSYWLPFRSMHYLPMAIYINRISPSEGLVQIVIQVVWVTILFFVYRFVWRKGVKQYDSVGN